MQEVLQKTPAAYDIVNVGSSPISDVTEDVIYSTLNIGHKIDVTHDRTLKGFLVLLGDNGKQVAMVRIQELLVEE